MNNKNFIENQHDGKLPLNRDGKKPRWLYNKAHNNPTQRGAKITYIIVHNPTTRVVATTTKKETTTTTEK